MVKIKQKNKELFPTYYKNSSENATKVWKTAIRIDNKLVQTCFEKEEHAAYWYDCLALEHYGSNAKINGIDIPNDFEVPSERNRDLPLGVSRKRNKYQARLSTKSLGVFETVKEAEQAYLKAKEDLESKKLSVRIGIQIIRNKDDIAIITTFKGEEILVDDDKYFNLKKYIWSINDQGYAVTRIDEKMMLMHRYLMNPTKNDLIDHINNNKIDNRLSNLRISNSGLNAHNRTKTKGSSLFKGVSLHKGRYIARITHHKKCINIGSFNTEEEAAKAYNTKAIELYGEFANLNILD